MENIDVISILDGIDWRDDFLRSPEAASSTEKLTEIVSNDMSVKDEREASETEEAEDMDEILAEVERLKAERGDRDNDSGTEVPGLMSAEEFQDWTRNLAKIDNTKIDNEIARERARVLTEEVRTKNANIKFTTH